jgi:quinol monooxygenase YgiN
MRTLTLALALAALALGSAAAQEGKKEPDVIARLKAVKGLKGPFTLIVHVQVKEGEEKAMLEAAKPAVAATLKEKGCLAYELHQDLEDPTKFVFYERWKSVEALRDHLGAAHTKKLLGAVGKIVSGAPKFAVYQRPGDR